MCVSDHRLHQQHHQLWQLFIISSLLFHVADYFTPYVTIHEFIRTLHAVANGCSMS
jgi:hypothetical protein